MTDDSKKKLHDHIRSFPRRKSHYGREHTVEYRYLDSNLTYKLMYDDFKAKNPDVKCSILTYRETMAYSYKLTFGKPRVDTCGKCDALENSRKNATDPAEIQSIENEQKAHFKSWNAFVNVRRSIKENCGENEELIYFDYMANQGLPRLTSGEAYYKRVINLFTFGIYQHTEKRHIFNIYTETIASKGSNDVVSLLDNFLSSLPENKRKIYLICDNCVGQNKNQTMLKFLYYKVGMYYKRICFF